jgi:tRNA (cmo5U34)-methyltransferase
MSDWEWNPDRYLELMHAEVPRYAELQERLAEAAAGVSATTILELGVGTGETTRRVLERQPGARVVGIDASAAMLAHARAAVPEAELLVSRLEDPLPPGPFDLVVSALALHHLDGPGKRDLFRRVARALGPGGRFVLADVIVPVDPADAVTPLSPGFDLPDRLEDQLCWLADAGFAAEPTWVAGDLAVVVADARRG